MKKTIEAIAKKVLSLETLETRNSDSLDFHEHSVWGIKEALEQAYNAGKKAGEIKGKKSVIQHTNFEVF